MKAVIKTGGKQYLVNEGLKLSVEKLDLEDGKTIDFEPLLVFDEEGKEIKVGTPRVIGAKVTATVLETGKGKKISVIKFKSKSRYRRNVGHRQPFTRIEINKISA